MSMPADHTTPGLVALVTHARGVRSDARERFAAAVATLADEPRAIVVRTCHRVEVYAISDPGDQSFQLPPPPDGGRWLMERDAARHLFRVAAGLDSVVVGEDQILHQLRECLALRHLAGFGSWDGPDSDGLVGAGHRGRVHPVLDRLFQVALHVGREARSWREGPPRSLADVALDVVEARVKSLSGSTLLVVGAGRMGRLVALGAARRGALVAVTNRTADRARALADDVGGRPVSWGSAPAVACDGIVLAISGTWDPAVVMAGHVAGAGRPVVDLSSPPALPAAIRERLDGLYVGVDDLAHGPADGVRDRMRHRLEQLIDDAEAEFAGWLRTREAVPAIQALAEQAEARRASELDRLVRRAALDDHERELVEQMSHRLVSGLLHAPLTRLRDDSSGELERAARVLFSL
jgi:glutamyl-tRNA reductase